jgi:periplasmic protein TonB
LSFSPEQVLIPIEQRREDAGLRGERPRRPPWELGALHLVGIAIGISLLLALGIHYVHELATDSASPGPRSSVQVHLISMPDHAPPSAAPTVARAAPNTESRPPPLPATPESPTLPTAASSLVAVARVANLEPPPDPQASPASSAARAAPDSIVSDYKRSLFQHIERVERYPDAARAKRLHGVVQVLFAMNRDGTLLGAWVKTSSGSAILDQAAIEAVRRAQPLPRIPSELPDRLNIVLPVEFETP